MRLVLPDCREYRDPFYLPAEMRRELILLIAEMGEAGIDEFVRRHEKDDSLIARRVARQRAKLLEEAQELRRLLKTQYDEAREKEQQRLAETLGRLRHEEKELRDREQKLEARLPHEIEQRIRSLPLLELAVRPPPKVSWVRRAWEAVARLVAFLWNGLLRLLGRRKPLTGKAKAIAVGIPGLSGPGVVVELDLESALRQNPDLRRQVRRRMGDTWKVRTRRLWRIMLGLDNYAEVAQSIMEEDARREAEARSREMRQELQRLEEERRKREQEEGQHEKTTQAELARLDQAEALERQRLESMLAARPAKDVSELVEGELEASGLVQKLEGEMQVTGRFLESLASIVYAEEARGLGSSYESPIGSTIEGEGILERTPLLSHDETSHMDTVSSLLQARTRHPHVRHLFEEDVLVYRERRASLTHVVIILDKSLSMEENERMEAGKRAVLALYWGVKKRSPQNQIDVILMDTSVVRANLGQAWGAKPGGFTNTGRAIEAARALLATSRASRKLLFLVTDGLPEALTIEGKDVAGRPEEAMAYAVRQAERLRDIKGLSTTVVLLEPKDPLFVKAGEQLSRKARGKLVKVTPQELTRSLLVELRDQEVEPPQLLA